jgi:hypothetical protein
MACGPPRPGGKPVPRISTRGSSLMHSRALEDIDRMAELVLIAFGVAALALLLFEVIYLAVVAIFLALGPRNTTSGSRHLILILGLGMASATAGPGWAAAQGTPDYPRPGFQPTPLGLDLYFFVPESNPSPPTVVWPARRATYPRRPLRTACHSRREHGAEWRRGTRRAS